MKDFDDIFRQKLQEEGEYSNRAKNWERLNERLDAFADGGSHFNQQGNIRSSLKYWLIGQSVAMIGLLTLAGVIWRDNILLHQKLDTLTSNTQPLTPVIQDKQVVSATVPVQQQLVEPIVTTIASPKKQVGTILQPGRSMTDEALTQQTAKTHDFVKPGVVTTPESQSTLITSGLTTKPKQPVNSLDDSVADKAYSGDINSLPVMPDSINALKEPINNNHLHPVLLPVNLPLKVVPQQKQAEKAAPVATMIQPARHQWGFKAGIEGLSGKILPDHNNVSLLVGQGLHAAVAIPRIPLWITTGAESWRFEESSKEFMQRFHRGSKPPSPPDSNNGGGGGGGGGGGSNHTHYELALVESSIRQQRYSLGMQYDLPRVWRIKPFVKAAHGWLRTPEHKVTYTFEERDDPGGPGHGGFHDIRYKVETVPTQITGNQLLLSAGFQLMLKQWSVDLQGNYQENLNAGHTSLDALFIKAGLTHHF